MFPRVTRLERAEAGHRRTLAVAGLAALVLVPGLVLVGAPPAHAAESIDVVVAFEDLVPGEARSEIGTYELVRDARHVGFDWIEREGVLRDAEIDVEACDAGGTCVDATRAAGQVLAAGPVRITLTVTLDRDAPQAADGSTTGRLTFTAEGEASAGHALPLTGAGAAGAALWALALALTGTVLLVARRRRHRDTTTPTPTEE